MKYRADIDGLRTVAVLLVILHHAGFNFLPGGFVGVDVFFVISGFLITSIITSSIQNHTFSFSSFLCRRIKRLMPVLFFVVLITGAIFSFVLLPKDLVKFYRGVIWVILYGANIFFWREHGGYFDGNSQEAPLLHTWSLAVEEQYYLIWPLMLLLSVRLFGVRKSKVLFLLFCVIMTFFSQWGTNITIGAAYYLMPTRLFELLAGSCLALWWSDLPKIKEPAINFLSVSGLCMIITSSIVLSEHSSFPGFNAAFPVLGSALIIYARGGIVNKILSLKPMVFTGALSYSLYLWHWPVFVFLRYTAIESTLPVKISCIFLIYFLAFLSWKYIENPFRNMGGDGFKSVFARQYLSPAALLIAVSLVGITYDGYPGRYSSEILQMEAAINSHASESRKDCHVPLRDSHKLPNDKCVFGEVSDDGPPSFFVFGDSHANHIVPFLEVMAKDANFQGQDYTLDRCLPVVGLNWGSNEHAAKKCRERNQLALDHINSNRFDYVVLAASWPEITTQRIITEQGPLDPEAKRTLIRDRFSETLEEISKTGATPVIIEDIPALNGKIASCTIKKLLFNGDLDCSVAKNPNQLLNELVSEASVSFPDLILIKPQNVFCSGEKCSMSLENIPLYRDDDHLNEAGAEMLGKMYIAKYGNPLTSTDTLLNLPNSATSLFSNDKISKTAVAN